MSFEYLAEHGNVEIKEVAEAGVSGNFLWRPVGPSLLPPVGGRVGEWDIYLVAN